MEVGRTMDVCNAFDEYGMRVELANRVGALYDRLVESSYSKDAAVSYRDLHKGAPASG